MNGMIAIVLLSLPLFGKNILKITTSIPGAVSIICSMKYPRMAVI
jgi:hypothetical protein